MAAITIDGPYRLVSAANSDRAMMDAAEIAPIFRDGSRAGLAVFAPPGLLAANLFIRYEDSRGRMHRTDLNAVEDHWTDRVAPWCRARERDGS